MLTATLLSLLVAQSPSLSQGRSMARQLAEGQPSEIWRDAAPALRAQFGSPRAFSDFVGRLRGMGEVVRVIAETMGPKNGFTLYRRTVAVSNWARGFEVEMLLDQAGHLAGLSAAPAAKEAPTIYGRYATKTTLRLPFQGTWYVLWGGRKYEDNLHTPVPDMRFALDLLVAPNGTGGGSCKGACRANDEYYAWNQPVLAPADGTVVRVEQGVVDNEPNRPRPGNIFGNYIVVDHGNDEYSLLAHLQKGSASVQPGDKVVAGQQLARVGNSGMSTEPHIHFQLMDEPDYQMAHGLPAQFSAYTANDRVVRRGEPARTEQISQAKVEATN